jgi:hypothetical protein
MLCDFKHAPSVSKSCKKLLHIQRLMLCDFKHAPSVSKSCKKFLHQGLMLCDFKHAPSIQSVPQEIPLCSVTSYMHAPIKVPQEIPHTYSKTYALWFQTCSFCWIRILQEIPSIFKALWNSIIFKNSGSVTSYMFHFYSPFFLVLSHIFGHLEQKLLGRLWKSLVFLKSNFFGSEKFQVPAHVLPK